MSNLKTGSVIPKLALFIISIIFLLIGLKVIADAIIDNIKAIDLLGNLGICFFSFSKKAFNPFFILLFASIIAINKITNSAIKIAVLY